MAHKTLIEGTPYEIIGGKALVEGTVRSINKSKVLVEGSVYEKEFISGTPISSLPVGSSVYFNVGGTRTEFIVVHHGIPASTQYHSSCDGTWVLMKDCHSSEYCGSSNYSNYSWTGNLHVFFNGDFFNSIEADVRNSIKHVSIPCIGGTGEWQYTVGNLDAYIFALSAYEVGLAGTDGSLPGLGAVLDYF